MDRGGVGGAELGGPEDVGEEVSSTEELHAGDKVRRDLASAYQKAMDNIFNRLKQLEITDTARKAHIDALERRSQCTDQYVAELDTSLREVKDRIDILEHHIISDTEPPQCL